MTLDVREAGPSILAEYAGISIAFTVERELALVARGRGESGSGGFSLEERPVATPWRKDYDVEDGEHPLEWPKHFDISHWGFLIAREAGTLVGGVAVAFDTPGLRFLEGRRELAVIWDIRVAPEARGRGVGAVLFRAAERWAMDRGVRRLTIETQNINVDACRFYERQGCVLGGINRFAYLALPGEVQLLWYKHLSAEGL